MWRHSNKSKRHFHFSGWNHSSHKSSAQEGKTNQSQTSKPCDSNHERSGKDLTSDTSGNESSIKSSCTNGSSSSTHKKHRRRSLRGGKLMHRVRSSMGHSVNSLGHHLDDLLSPKTDPSVSARIRVNNGVLLIRCKTEDEHNKAVDEFLDLVKDVHGEEGLHLAGFEYRPVYCDHHSERSNDGDVQEKDKLISLMEKAVIVNRSDHERTQRQPDVQAASCIGIHSDPLCSHCTTRLFHKQSDTIITEENRRRYIADGPMYEETARLCQEYAQELMQREGHLEWITICNDEARGEPVRALVHVDHEVSTGASTRSASAYSTDSEEDENCQIETDASVTGPKPTLLIATGKGKVRAGIFSRHHLLVSGIEPSTSLPMVREASRREMNVAILDPNARGDKQGMITFEQSLGKLFGHWEEEESQSQCDKVHDLYILAHSQSGSQLVQYLLARAKCYLPRIRAIAFTDSTHNIQWTKRNLSVKNLLESSACVYVRSSNVMRDSNWQEHQAGDVVKTDQFWRHRFGTIHTVWGGTKEHSKINWTAHSHIWEHFDRYLSTNVTRDGGGVDEENQKQNNVRDTENQKPLEDSETAEPSKCSRGVHVGAFTV